MAHASTGHRLPERRATSVQSNLTLALYGERVRHVAPLRYDWILTTAGVQIRTATLGRPVSTKAVDEAGSHPSEEAMYVAVTRAWFLLVSRDQPRDHPLEPYVFGPQFVRSVVGGPVEPRVVALACAKLACRYPWERDAAEPVPVPVAPAVTGDMLSTWWRAFGGPDDLGVHYDELAGGVLEFLFVGGWKERPPREFRRS